MLQLWQQGFLLIFKPIGDFIGILMRPVVALFYAFLGDWYRRNYFELMQKAFDMLANLENNLSGGWALLHGDWDKVNEEMKAGNENMDKSLGNILEGILGLAGLSDN